MGAFSNQLIQVARRAAAPAQAGVFSGDKPTVYNASDPIPLWIIQVVIIIGMIQLLALFLGRIRQPRVIAEVIAGIILGPSVMGHIPNFTATIFPNASIPLLYLTANIGLVLFLFLVGLEIDVRLIKRNARASMAISAVGLVIPLGLGAALAVPIYNVFTDGSTNFGYFILFIAVAVGITAFPVLCRILTELKLLDTTVGVVVLSAGVGNDVVGWILLALAVALVNASSGLTALWVLLAAVAYILFLTIPVRLAFRWLARRTGCLQSGEPSAMIMTLIIIIVLVSAFYTDIIGIHPIFGGFLAGLIIPHDNGFAIAIVEKLEDLVSILFLPLYFAYSGLRTNLGLLNNGITWGYTILICVVAFCSKFFGCAVMAKLTGFTFRESGAIGALMSCKGLVELIVLNVGLSAGILDTRTFSMFVLHALVLTFMTTPLTLLFYPARVRVHDGPGNKRGVDIVSTGEDGTGRGGASEEGLKTKFAVVLDRMEQLPAVMTLTQLLQYPSNDPSPMESNSRLSSSDEKVEKASTEMPNLPQNHAIASCQPRISMNALRLIELTDRTSAVMKSQEADSLIRSDPMLAVFRTFGYLNGMTVSTALSVVSPEEFSSSVASHVRDASAQMVILPWSSGFSSSEETTEPSLDAPGSSASNPFDTLFPQKRDRSSAVVHSHFIRKVFADTPADVALFVDRGFPQSYDGKARQHIFLPFFGGPDDRLALTFVAQLCMNPAISATVVRVKKTAVATSELTPYNSIDEAKAQHLLHSTITSLHNTTFPDTVYGARDTQTRLASDTADNILWTRLASSPPGLSDALSRIAFLDQSTARPLHAMLDAASSLTESRSRLLVVVGRSRRMAVESHHAELRELCTKHGISPASEMPKTLGEVAAAFIMANTSGSLLVLQASP
ncbi:K(+)/H(+) antiporter 1 [Grifola frondosa]|uniref:K(+)/H(+) antiporter 1 n=1 Tax=Grifola frondosa TaxID=5627 RepID=A0A1C7LZI6_GRIFR|nr:K(+)/H(+) antiporter 1 [Grifola frondosa]